MKRLVIPKYHRILLKLSGETFGGSKGFGFDYKSIRNIANHVISVVELSVSVGVVVGGGNVFRGARSSEGNIGRIAGDHMGMLATVINSLYLQEMLEQQQVPTRVMSAIEMREVCEPYIKRRADRHLEKQRVVIFAAGTGNPFFTTDTAAVLRATEIGAEVVIKATKTDGVYDRDPQFYDDAKRFTKLDYDEVLSRNLKVMDATAIAFCRDNKIPILVLDLNNPDSIRKAVCGEKVGTLIN